MKNIPDFITVQGHGITRTVWVDGECLPNSEIYNWGYTKGESPLNLATAILKRFFPEELILKYATAFKISVVGLIPNENFKVKIALKKWVKTYERELPPCSALEFMEVFVHPEFYIPKYLDFPNLALAQGDYNKNTKEFQLLVKLTDTEMLSLEEYIKVRTFRQVGVGDNKRDVWATLEYCVREGIYKYRDGLGSQKSTGTNG